MEYKIIFLTISILIIIYLWYRSWQKYKPRNTAEEIEKMLEFKGDENYFDKYKEKDQ